MTFECLVLRLPYGQKILEDFSVKSVLSINSAIDIASHELLVTERTAKHMIKEISILGVHYHCDKRPQNLAHFFTPEVLQCLELKRRTEKRG